MGQSTASGAWTAEPIWNRHCRQRTECDRLSLVVIRPDSWRRALLVDRRLEKPEGGMTQALVSAGSPTGHYRAEVAACRASMVGDVGQHSHCVPTIRSDASASWGALQDRNFDRASPFDPSRRQRLPHRQAR